MTRVILVAMMAVMTMGMDEQGCGGDFDAALQRCIAQGRCQVDGGAVDAGMETITVVIYEGTPDTMGGRKVE